VSWEHFLCSVLDFLASALPCGFPMSYVGVAEWSCEPVAIQVVGRMGRYYGGNNMFQAFGVRQAEAANDDTCFSLSQ